MMSVYQKLSTNDTLLQFYHHHTDPGDNFDNSVHPDQPCDAQCRTDILSSILNVAPPRPAHNEALLTDQHSRQRRFVIVDEND